ncbi:Ig-like domain-containing protein [Shewanella youngdeokensis]|uniref:Ig-like domain-containing protein n=1 Tax=Shewanella youngdeokensis TaxID=2999068 RepID=A0ABZ0JWT6_9GAMM|nr:Ig-like domain-containing protein [Shewanella sp. DAU334]
MRLIKKLAVIPVTLLSLSALSGCNGSSDGSSDVDNGGTYSLSISYKTVENGVCSTTTDALSFDANASFCAVAHLKQDNSNRSGKLIAFSGTLGELSAPNKLTDASGLAEIIISNSSATVDAGTLTASFTEDEYSATATRNYEFIATTTPTEPTYTLNTAIINGSDVVTQFKAEETVQLQAEFLDASSVGIAGQMVTFTAGSAALNPSSALTNADGIAQVSYTPADTELGAASMTVTLDYADVTYQNSSFYEVLAADAVSDEGTIMLGSFTTDTDSGEETFIEGKLSTTPATTDEQYTVSAGGSFGVTATLVSQDADGVITRLQTPTSVSFSSSCVESNNASIDSPVTTLSGTASATFQNTSCSGNSERSDQIIATVTAGNETLTADLDFNLAQQTLANLSFVSAEPASIRIKGAGGTDASESSLITFSVTDANGQAIAQQTVDFTLDTTVGGIAFSNGDPTISSISNSAGLVTTTVLSGTIPTPVRVVATATTGTDEESVTSQSEQLTINTGLPQQLGFSVSADTVNPEAGDHNGEVVTITAYASDSFGNPAPDDTTINFTAEGGQIEPSCVTLGGTCSVEWTSTSPRPTDHRVTVLAYALGHETFFDTNGNNVFDDADGGAIALACLDDDGSAKACSGNGLDIDTYHAQGFIDLGDAFRDDDESGDHTSGEPYFNTAADNYNTGDELFNGPQCTSSSLCGTEQANKTYIRKALIITMSGSEAYFEIEQDGTPIYSNDNATISTTEIPAGDASTFTVRFFDSAGQIMPAQSTLTTTASAGELDADAFEVRNRNSLVGSTTSFTLINGNEAGSGEPDETSIISIEVVTPKSIKSSIGFNVLLKGS